MYIIIYIRAYAELLQATINVDSDDDLPDIEILPQCSFSTNSCTELQTARSLLERLSDSIMEEPMSRFNINRLNIWDGAMKGMKRVSFSPAQRFIVRFADDNDVSEGAIDQGGPRREFLRLLMSYIHGSNLFTGDAHSKNITMESRGKQSDKIYFVLLCYNR